MMARMTLLFTIIRIIRIRNTDYAIICGVLISNIAIHATTGGAFLGDDDTV